MVVSVTALDGDAVPRLGDINDDWVITLRPHAIAGQVLVDGECSCGYRIGYSTGVRALAQAGMAAGRHVNDSHRADA